MESHDWAAARCRSYSPNFAPVCKRTDNDVSYDEGVCRSVAHRSYDVGRILGDRRDLCRRRFHHQRRLRAFQHGFARVHGRCARLFLKAILSFNFCNRSPTDSLPWFQGPRPNSVCSWPTRASWVSRCPSSPTSRTHRCCNKEQIFLNFDSNQPSRVAAVGN